MQVNEAHQLVLTVETVWSAISLNHLWCNWNLGYVKLNEQGTLAEKKTGNLWILPWENLHIKVCMCTCVCARLFSAIIFLGEGKTDGFCNFCLQHFFFLDVLLLVFILSSRAPSKLFENVVYQKCHVVGGMVLSLLIDNLSDLIWFWLSLTQDQNFLYKSLLLSRFNWLVQKCQHSESTFK